MCLHPNGDFSEWQILLRVDAESACGGYCRGDGQGSRDGVLAAGPPHIPAGRLDRGRLTARGLPSGRAGSHEDDLRVRAPRQLRPDQVKAIRVTGAGDALLASSITRRLVEELSRQRPVAPGIDRLAAWVRSPGSPSGGKTVWWRVRGRGCSRPRVRWAPQGCTRRFAAGSRQRCCCAVSWAPGLAESCFSG